MIKQILAITALSFVSGVLYRMGGADGFNTKFRDLGVPVCMVLVMWVLGQLHWSLILCFELMFGSCTTYFKKKGEDAEWWNWLLVGLAFSISMLPLIIFNHHWLGFGIRTVVCTSLITLWSQFIGKAVLEETGRGAMVIGTLPLLLI